MSWWGAPTQLKHATAQNKEVISLREWTHKKTKKWRRSWVKNKRLFFFVVWWNERKKSLLQVTEKKVFPSDSLSSNSLTLQLRSLLLLLLLRSSFHFHSLLAHYSEHSRKCRRLLETKPFLCCKNEVTREDSKKWQRREKTSVCHFHPLFLPFQWLSSPFEWVWRVEKQSQFVAKKRIAGIAVEKSMNQKCRLHAPTMATEEQKRWEIKSDLRALTSTEERKEWPNDDKIYQTHINKLFFPSILIFPNDAMLKWERNLEFLSQCGHGQNCVISWPKNILWMRRLVVSQNVTNRYVRYVDPSNLPFEWAHKKEARDFAIHFGRVKDEQYE